MMVDHFDVIVVGAGLSGLSSAKLLSEEGLDVLVLEASERVGGRLHTHRNANCEWVDWGGAYIGPTQLRVLRMAKELGLRMYKVNNVGDWIYYNNGSRQRFTSTLPVMHPLAWLDANNMFRKFDELGEGISMAEPWKSKDAKELDNMTLQEWYNQTVWTKSAMDVAKGFSRVNFTAEPHEISLLWALWYVRQAGGTLTINSTENGAQQMKFDGGAGQLPERIADNLGIGRCVLLRHPVCKIEHSSQGAILTTTNGRNFKADYVIFGNAPALQMKIEFQPSLPALRNQLIQRVPMGSVIKTMVYYKSPFWRDQGLCGTILIDDPDPTLPIIGTMDDTKPDGSHACIMGFVQYLYVNADYVIFGNAPALQMKIEFQPSLPALRNQLIQRVPMGSVIKTMVYYKSPFWRDQGLCGTILIDDPDPTLPIIGTMDDTKPDGSHACIMGFLLCDKGRDMLRYTREERLRIITECYARTFGMKEFLNYEHYEEKNWMEDPWTGGCYTGFAGPGVITNYGPAIREPIGRLFFAGTEAATEWTGYMEGAVQSGERAAREVLHKMNKISQEEVWRKEPESPDHKSVEMNAGLMEQISPSVPGLIKLGGVLSATAIATIIMKSKL